MEDASELTRRGEPYRYSFVPELPCLIRLREANGFAVRSKPGQALLIDMSPQGCKLESALNFRLPDNECKVILSVRLTRELELRGTMIWQEERTPAFAYGIQLEETHRDELEEEIRAYAEWKQLVNEGIVPADAWT
ncbi:PilZ domain-containing protein [Cohnella xylanilytica]|uniref:PilZ domain-containing protein n=1 Tax=Cohnella xylanilytica TaxID=557555 RepID=A0A841U714_9BACL|nr:PilZ domain-containing protein [Cohnella xylanilytica]MBB6693770.1 PilZ domain-containing protein [Cohnella xylanilytica]